MCSGCCRKLGDPICLATAVLKRPGFRRDFGLPSVLLSWFAGILMLEEQGGAACRRAIPRVPPQGPGSPGGRTKRHRGRRGHATRPDQTGLAWPTPDRDAQLPGDLPGLPAHAVVPIHFASRLRRQGRDPLGMARPQSASECSAATRHARVTRRRVGGAAESRTAGLPSASATDRCSVDSRQNYVAETVLRRTRTGDLYSSNPQPGSAHRGR